MSTTTNPEDPGINKPGLGGQNAAYLILSEEERSKGFVRPVRRSYVHTGEIPKYPLREPTEEERQNTEGMGYIKVMDYPPEEAPKIKRFFTKKQLNGCGVLTTMAQSIAETYAREPGFYGATYCCGCKRHLPVSEFVWEDTCEVVGS